MAVLRQMPAVPLKLKKRPGTVAGRVLDHEVAVEEDRLQVGDQRKIAVQMAPAHLHHADIGRGEKMDGVLQEMLMGNEVGVEHGDELALGHFHAFFQGAGLVTLAVLAVQVGDVQALLLVLFDAARGDGHGLVGGIVQDLYLQQAPADNPFSRPHRSGAWPRTSRCTWAAGWSPAGVPRNGPRACVRLSCFYNTDRP